MMLNTELSDFSRIVEMAMLQKSVFLAAPDIYIYAYLKFYLVILLTGEVEAVIMRLTDTDLNLHIISPLHRATLLTSTE